MTKEELASRLTGSEYPFEVNGVTEFQAKENKLLVIFGASDDLMEIRGYIHDEIGASTGAVVLIGASGQILPHIEPEEREVLEKFNVLDHVLAEEALALEIEAQFGEVEDYTWTYKTDAPHATFEIMEDGDRYCRGIVIDLKEVF